MMDFRGDQDQVFGINLGAGLDTESTRSTVSPGSVISSLNYEPRLGGGYQRAGGWLRYDGRPRPSDADVVILSSLSDFGAMTIGATVSATPSGATGTLVYASGKQAAVVRVTGDFDGGDMLRQGGTNKGLVANDVSATFAEINAAYAGAEDFLRAEIQPVPGVGPVRGLGMLGGVLYAFRDFDVSTQRIYKATGSGWVNVPLLHRVAFTNGTTEYFDGGTLTQGGVTATIRRVIAQTGDWTTGNKATGFLVISGATGNFAAGAAIGSGACTLSGPQQPITLAAGGRWVLSPYAFTGAAMRLYGADGKNDLIEFDGEVLAQIPVGMPVKPSTLELHKGHVWAAFGNSVQRSGIFDPYQWTVISGSAELAIGDTVTEIVSVSGSEKEAALLILSKDKSSVVYGDSSDYRIGTLSTETGAMPYTAQVFGGVVALDAAGVRDFSPTNAFGNFVSSTLTSHLSRLVANLSPTASVVSRNASRYRVFLSDGSWLCGIPGKRWSWTICTSPYPVNVTCEGEQGGISRLFLGCMDGYVREMDAGRSFDGQEIEFLLKTNHSALGAVGFAKSVRMTDVDSYSQSAASISYQMEVDFGGDDSIDTETVSKSVAPSSSLFDSGKWDIAIFDGKAGQALKIRTPGRGEYFSFSFFGSSKSELPHEIFSLNVHYFVRRKIK